MEKIITVKNWTKRTSWTYFKRQETASEWRNVLTHLSGKIEKPNDINSTTVRMATTKKTKDNKFWWGCESETLALDRVMAWCSHYK